MSYPRELKNRFIAMRSVCYSYDKISAILGVSKTSLIKWGIQFRKEIAALEYADAQALKEKYLHTRRAQLVDDLKELVKIQKAIKLKNLSKINISTLLEMESIREDKIAKRLEELENNADLAKAGLDKDLLSACNDDAVGRVEGLMDNFMEKFDDKIRASHERSRMSPQEITNKLYSSFKQSVNEERGADRQGPATRRTDEAKAEIKLKKI